MKTSLSLLTAATLAAATLTPAAQAGSCEWSTAGKVLTGIFAAHVVADIVFPRAYAYTPAPTVVYSAPAVVYAPGPAAVVYAPPAPTVVGYGSAPVYIAAPAPVYYAAPSVVFVGGPRFYGARPYFHGGNGHAFYGHSHGYRHR